MSPAHVPSSHSEILQAYWESNNNLSGSGDTSCSHHLSQQCPEAPCHKRAIIISGDFLVRWHLDAVFCSLPAGGSCPGAIRVLGGTRKVGKACLGLGGEGWREQPCTQHLVLGGFEQSCPVFWVVITCGHTGTYWAHGHSTCSVMNLEQTRVTLLEHC